MRHPIALSLSIALWCSEIRADPPGSWLERELVAELTRRAAQRAHLDEDAPRALASRARAAGWIPRVSGRVARGFGASSTQYLLPDSDRVATTDTLAFEVRVTFALERAVFAPQEVELLRLSAQQAAQRRALDGAVIELLARLETLRRAGTIPLDDPRTVQRLRLLAELEQLTGVALTR